MKNIAVKKSIFKRIRAIDVYIVAYFVVSLLFLTKFPFMHSDESWLSGLTRTMMAGGLSETEYFFDLLPRYPHAIKSVFHILQMGFIWLFGYNLFAVRLLSLIFGTVVLYAFFGLAKCWLSKKHAFIVTVILSLDIQFIYASHFARQEIVVLAGMVICLLILVKHQDAWGYKKDILVGTLVGLTIGIHPNSFIVALVVGVIYVYNMLVLRKQKFGNLAVVVGVTVVFAAVFVGISFLFDAQFIPHYLTYGDNLGPTQTWLQKAFAFPKFYGRLFNQVAVTYYLPYIKPQLLLFGTAGIVALTVALICKKQHAIWQTLFVLVAINLGIYSIGRFSQVSIVFIFPFGYLLVALLLAKLKKAGTIIAIVMGAGVVALTLFGVALSINTQYSNYKQQINLYVPADENVLANLNAEYAFEYDKLHDYRNLAYLEENNMTFADYIEQNKIDYIVYPQEMDYIYNNRPTWNVVYGNVYPYYNDMQLFLNNQCQVVGTFNSPYAMRIRPLTQGKDWAVTIYKVIEEN